MDKSANQCGSVQHKTPWYAVHTYLHARGQRGRVGTRGGGHGMLLFGQCGARMIELLAMHNTEQLLACATAQLQDLLVGAAALTTRDLLLRRRAASLNMTPHGLIGILSL